jgi:hypothetical protein
MMNERIDQLLVKAGAYFGGEGVVYDTFDPKKFAELIVRECVKLCEHKSNDDEYDQYDMGQSVKAENIKTSIKKHFGVKE